MHQKVRKQIVEQVIANEKKGFKWIDNDPLFGQDELQAATLQILIPEYCDLRKDPKQRTKVRFKEKWEPVI